jgi:hypothetical protein
MGFYGPEPFDGAKAFYVWTGLNEPGHFSVDVRGNAPNYTSGIQLVRDPDFVGGLRIEVMGWTGPVGPGTKAYHVSGTFSGMFVPKIVVTGANGTHLITVEEIPQAKVEEFLKGRATPVAAAAAA